MKQMEDKQKKRLWRRWLWLSGRWLSLGLGLKRWLLVLGLGAALTGLGLVYVLLLLERWGWLPRRLYDLIGADVFAGTVAGSNFFMRAGLGLIALAVWRMGLNLVTPFTIRMSRWWNGCMSITGVSGVHMWWLLAAVRGCPICCAACGSIRAILRPLSP
jgi:hypothetical protein